MIGLEDEDDRIGVLLRFVQLIIGRKQLAGSMATALVLTTCFGSAFFCRKNRFWQKELFNNVPDCDH